MVLEILQRADGGESYRALGRAFGVTHRAIRLIVRRETWTHISYPSRGQVAATDLLFPAGLS